MCNVYLFIFRLYTNRKCKNKNIALKNVRKKYMNFFYKFYLDVGMV